MSVLAKHRCRRQVVFILAERLLEIEGGMEEAKIPDGDHDARQRPEQWVRREVGYRKRGKHTELQDKEVAEVGEHVRELHRVDEICFLIRITSDRDFYGYGRPERSRNHNGLLN